MSHSLSGTTPNTKTMEIVTQTPHQVHIYIYIPPYKLGLFVYLISFYSILNRYKHFHRETYIIQINRKLQPIKNKNRKLHLNVHTDTLLLDLFVLIYFLVFFKGHEEGVGISGRIRGKRGNEENRVKPTKLRAQVLWVHAV